MKLSMKTLINRTLEAPIVVSKISEEDIEKVHELFKIYEQQLGINLCFQDFEKELQTLPGIYAEPRGSILKATIGEEIIGCVALKPLDSHTCEMKRLFVLNKHKGKGAGQELAIQLINEAKLKGYQLMKLDTLDRLKPAVKLYHKLGFEQTQPYNYNPEADILYFQLSLTDN